MQPGDLVANRYQLDSRIDGGAMGNVWRGRDTRLNRPVAIKVLHSALSEDPRFRARFENEARAVAGLTAPGIVALYDYGEDDTPEGVVSYLIMELVTGSSLASLIREKGTLSVPETMRIVSEAADALHVAHHSGLIHRDIKPANMLIAGDGTVKIVDFGIARAKGEVGLTETGMVMGTLAYCSPEHLRDNGITPVSDIYSLGIVAYECLAGRPPFPSSNPGAAVHGHINQAPPPLPHHVPPAVSNVIMRALAKNPNDRWSSAAQFAKACKDAAHGGGTTAIIPPPATASATQIMPSTRPTPIPPRTAPRPLPPPEEHPEPERSSKGIAVAVIAVVLGVALLGALLVIQPWRTDPEDVAEDDASPTVTESAEEPDNSEEPSDEESVQPGSGQDSGPDTEPSSQEPTEDLSRPVPGVVGMPFKDAQGQLLQAGFVQVTGQIDGEGESDTPCMVTSQTPGENESVDPTTTKVVLSVSGSAEQYEACPKL